MNINNRLYNELSDWEHSRALLVEYVEHKKRRINILEAILTFVSIIGIAGWYRYEEWKTVWLSIIIVTIGIRLFKGFLVASKDDLFSMKSSIAFYNVHILDLEKLYYEYYSMKSPVKTIENKFFKLKKKERDQITRQTFGKLKPTKKCAHRAEETANVNLLKLKSNLYE